MAHLSHKIRALNLRGPRGLGQGDTALICLHGHRATSVRRPVGGLLRWMAACLAGLLLAQQAAAQEVAVLNVDEAIQRTAYFQERAQELQARADYSELVQEGQDLQTKLTDLQDEIRRDADTLTESEVTRMRRQAEELVQELQLVGRKVQQRQEEFFGDVIDELRVDVQEVVQQIYNARKIRILLTRQAALVVDPSADITADVVRAVDRLREERGNGGGNSEDK